MKPFLLSLLLATMATSAFASPQKLNILFITADDMNYDTPGFTGCKVPDITPNLDRLAGEGLRFVNAHVTVAVCQPSRECLMTGRYPHHNGATGFYPVRGDVPTLQELLKSEGYHLGILGKVGHLAPAEKFPWNFKRDQGDLGAGRDPEKYYQFTREFLAQAKTSAKPFFLMANSHDPHRPFAGSEKKRTKAGSSDHADSKEKQSQDTNQYPAPSRTYKPEEIIVPGFLPDLPDIRKEMAQYFSSAHRADQTIGEILRALKESGLEDSTLVMFVSDNGISMPFAKSNCYLSSTRTPWLIRWPGKIKPGTVDSVHFISGIDFMPTILDACGLKSPGGMDGSSFLPLLKGGRQPERDHVFTCYNENSGRKAYVMRCLQDRQFGYIFNGWSDGMFKYNTEPMGGLTFKAMQRASAENKSVADRVELLVHRVPEEFFDLLADPNALNNLIADPKHQTQIQTMRRAMLVWMERTQDPSLPDFRARVTSKSAAK